MRRRCVSWLYFESKDNGGAAGLHQMESGGTGSQNTGPKGSMCMGSSEELTRSTDHILRREMD